MGSCLGLLVALLALSVDSFAQTTLADNFDSRTRGTADLSPVSPQGLSWSTLAGGVRVDPLVAQTDVPGSLAMIWPRSNGSPLDTLVVANEIVDWNSFTIDFGWSSKYVRKTAGMLLLYKDPDNFYFIRLASLTDGELIRRMGGVETILARGDFEPPDVGDSVVTAYRFEVSASAAGILFRVDRGIDGSLELEYTDSDSGALSTLGAGGKIGLRCLSDNGSYHLVYIDRISVTGAHVELGQPLPTATPTVTNTQAVPPTPTHTSAIPPTPTSTSAGPATPSRTPTPTLVVDQTGQPGRVDPVTDLAVAPSPRPGGYRLTWTAPDGNLDLAGMQAAAAYDIRYSAGPMTTEDQFNSAAKIPNIPDPWIGGLAQSVECFSLPGGTLHFRMKVIGTNVSTLSNAASGAASSGAPQWAVPANRKVGIDLRLAGVENADYVYEVLFYDTNIDDHGVLYVRDSVEMTLAHNAKNSKPAQLWTGGQPGVSPPSSVDPGSLAGDSGVIRYRFDSDGLRYWDGKQAYVQNGQTYGTDRWKAHPMFKQYTGAFTPKTFYDSIESDGIATPSERVGQVNGADVDSRYSKGYIDPNSGDEWHELAYWDDDRGWIGSNERHSQASDGRVVWVVLNPKTPALSFSAGSGGRFFTTRPKSYFQGRVNPQTTYFSGNVDLTLTNLSPNPGPVRYRIAGGNWTDVFGPISLSTLNLAANTPTELETRIGANGPIKRRTLVREPAIATASETHPVIICRAEERASLLTRILSNSDLANEYKKLKTNGNQIKGLMGRNYEIDEKIRF
ncbi:MAG: hypothetical protein HUU16_19515, partial [Candidatus Omnitrophica bacterium]|nr:hypothetical protein [Candidatus Omnitrophota bacterium]